MSLMGRKQAFAAQVANSSKPFRAFKDDFYVGIVIWKQLAVIPLLKLHRCCAMHEDEEGVEAVINSEIGLETPVF